jgi:hypothetical protein
MPNFVGQNPGGGYDYQEGDSESDFINRNLQNDLKGQSGLDAAGHIMVGDFAGASAIGAYRGLRGKSAYKSARKRFARQRRALEARTREKLYSDYQGQQEHQAAIDSQKRQDALDALERGFADPSRAAARYSAYQANLGNEVAQLNKGYHDSSQRASQEAVRRGRLGSSTDAEKQAALSTSLNSGIMGAENAANDQLSALQDQDDQQLQSLRRSLLSGDPQAQQTYRAQAEQASGGIDRILASGAQAQQRREQQAQEQYDRYAMYGGLANAGAAGVYGAYGNPQYGGGGY